MSVIVFANSSQGVFKKPVLEGLSYGFATAKALGQPLTVFCAGEAGASEIQGLGKFGAGRILHLSDSRINGMECYAIATAMVKAAKSENATVLVFPHSVSGRAVAPMVAAILEAGMVSGVIEIPKSGSDFVVRKKAFSGKALADVKINTPVKVLTVATNAFGLVENQRTTEVIPFDPGFSGKEFQTILKDTVSGSGKLGVSEAEVVVSGGRGMKGPENWNVLESLADALGAATACSKPVSDIGWRPHSEHVGQTGKAIAPNLYIALGISGAIQHIAGINSSKVIVAVNKDPDAPIFKSADYGIVGDIFEVVPKITEAVKKFKAGNP